MSIRLRLTLLYTAILTLTLLLFGVALYFFQARDTLNFIEDDIIRTSERVTDGITRQGGRPPLEEGAQPKSFGDFSGEKTFQNLREREIIRVLDQDGSLIVSPNGRMEDALPLSEEGLAAVQAQEVWWEKAEYNEEEILIYTYPIIEDGEIKFIVQIARSLAERSQTLKTLVTTLGGASAIIVLLAFLIGWTLSGITLRPIDRITQTAQKIGEERDFTRRVDHVGPEDEVGRLANTFNQMLSRLEDAYQQVGHALEMQRNFVADVSHELRTPLTTLRGNLGLLHRKPTAEIQDDILVDMVDESDRLIRLVNDLLLLARADAGRSLAKETLDLYPLLEKSARQANELDNARIINLSDSKDYSIFGDRDAFKQVMLILLDNALKHSHGDVDISVEEIDGFVQVSVKDYGNGIPPETLSHIFDRFYRGEESITTPGFGLGLPIAKALVEGMGGEIDIESEAGQGSVVRLKFLRT